MINASPSPSIDRFSGLQHRGSGQGREEQITVEFGGGKLTASRALGGLSVVAPARTPSN
jgi:hypothetical protein